MVDEHDGWSTSTEGDLDPDLTEEAGYAGWEQPQRPWAGLLFRAGLAVTLVCVLGGALLVLLR